MVNDLEDSDQLLDSQPRLQTGVLHFNTKLTSAGMEIDPQGWFEDSQNRTRVDVAWPGLDKKSEATPTVGALQPGQQGGPVLELSKPPKELKQIPTSEKIVGNFGSVRRLVNGKPFADIWRFPHPRRSWKSDLRR
jgi:hypothetical protein